MTGDATGPHLHFQVMESPWAITVGSDNALRFAMSGADAIGRMTTTGSFSTFTIPTANPNPIGITAGPDGALWFTENSTNRIGRLTTAGTFTEYVIPRRTASRTT